MGYRAYPEYKDSAVEWLGKIPSHWDQCPVKRKFMIANGSTPKSGEAEFWDGDILWITPADFSRASSGYLNESGRTITDAGLASCGTRLVPSNSIVVSVRAPIGEVIQAASELCTNQGCKSLIKDASEIHERFFFYVFSCSSKQLNALGLGTTFMELSTHGLGQYRAPLPPHQEQEIIAKFLDYKAAQIDRLIEKKQELTEKLQEQRITTITQAVTKGFENNVLMKDSGVKWLGDIPESWDALRSRYCTKFITSGSRGWAEFFTEDGSPFLRITNLDRNSIDLLPSDIQRVSPPENAEGERTKTFAGDVLVSITADLGSVAVIPDDFERSYVSQHIALVRPEREKVLSKWLAYSAFSASGKSQLLGAGYGGTKTQLSLGDIKEIYIALPPELELQKELINEVDLRLEKINRIYAATELAISSLQEYRAALITAAVTGKIDVRGWQAPASIKEPAPDKEVA